MGAPGVSARVYNVSKPPSQPKSKTATILLQFLLQRQEERQIERLVGQRHFVLQFQAKVELSVSH